MPHLDHPRRCDCPPEATCCVLCPSASSAACPAAGGVRRGSGPVLHTGPSRSTHAEAQAGAALWFLVLLCHGGEPPVIICFCGWDSNVCSSGCSQQCACESSLPLGVTYVRSWAVTGMLAQYSEKPQGPCAMVTTPFCPPLPALAMYSFIISN